MSTLLGLCVWGLFLGGGWFGWGGGISLCLSRCAVLRDKSHLTQHKILYPKPYQRPSLSASLPPLTPSHPPPPHACPASQSETLNLPLFLHAPPPRHKATEPTNTLLSVYMPRQTHSYRTTSLTEPALPSAQCHIMTS